MLETPRKKLTFLLCLALIIIWMCGCGSAYHLRKAKKHLAKAVEKGAVVDSLKTVKWDTVRITSTKDSLIVDQRIDTLKIVERCEEIIESVKTGKKPVLQDLKQDLCPPLKVDTTYRIIVTAPDGEYILPVYVFVDSETGVYKFSTGQVEVPVKKEEVSVTIKPKDKWTKPVVIASLVLLVIAAVRFLIPRK